MTASTTGTRTAIRTAYLQAAAGAATLLESPAVATSWTAASALREFTVSGLAGHLARQVLLTPPMLTPPMLTLEIPRNSQEPIGLLEHYARSQWIDADLDDEISVNIRAAGEAEAAEGPAALAAAVKATLEGLDAALDSEPPDRVVHLPWAGWSLTLDDFLTTRLMEIVVHSDDLAVSVGAQTPESPPAVVEPVILLLTSLAVRRHGATAVLRALSRAERAPDTIAAF